MIKHFSTDKELIEYYKEEIEKILGFAVTIQDLNQKDNQINLYYQKHNENNYIQILSETKPIVPIARFQLIEFPGCCAFMVSYHSNISDDYRGKGLGLLLNSMRMDIARFLGYSALLCTDLNDNIPQRKILAKNDWKDIFNIVNQRTRNNINISIVQL